jgi:hypothetical protein
MMIWTNMAPLLVPHFVHRPQFFITLRLSTNRFSIATGKAKTQSSKILLVRVMEL